MNLGKNSLRAFLNENNKKDDDTWLVLNLGFLKLFGEQSQMHIILNKGMVILSHYPLTSFLSLCFLYLIAVTK